MMKVYVLYQYDYGGDSIVAVYSSKEKAEARKSQESYQGNLAVLEFGLDEEPA